MSKYFSWILLIVALASSTASNADQITIINKLNFPSRCIVVWDQDLPQNEELPSNQQIQNSNKNGRQASDQQATARVYERVDLITPLTNKPTPQIIKIPSFPNYKAVGFRIACDSIGNTSIHKGQPKQATLIPGKTYTLERGAETAGTRTTFVTRGGTIVQESTPTTDIELIITSN
jgi:hypothetical protein